jgi:hypothetical protein
MNIVPFLLQVVALVCLLLAALNVPSRGRIQWFAAGMFLWLLSLMVSGIELHAVR